MSRLSQTASLRSLRWEDKKFKINVILRDTHPVALIARDMLGAQAQAPRAFCLNVEPGGRAASDSSRWLRGVSTDLVGTSGQILPKVLILQMPIGLLSEG